MNLNPCRILILGDSHTSAIRDACIHRDESGKRNPRVQFEVHWLQSSKHGDLSRDEAVKLVSSLAPTDILGVSLGGTLHNVLGLAQHPRRFDVYLNSDDTVADREDSMIIPRQALMDEFNRGLHKLIIKYKKLSACNVYYHSTPPPKQDHDYILASTLRYRNSLLLETGITPAYLRLKLWRLEMVVMKNLCDDAGVIFLHSPAQAQNDDGFLRKDLYGKDATHTNKEYGELVLQQMESLIVKNMEKLTAHHA